MKNHAAKLESKRTTEEELVWFLHYHLAHQSLLIMAFLDACDVLNQSAGGNQFFNTKVN